MRRSKKIAICLIIGLVAFCTFLAHFLNVGTTEAYLADNGKKTSQITFGNGGCQIIETFQRPNLQTGTNQFTKKVSVKNTGSVSQYVRVFADFSDYRFRDASEISSDNGKTWYSCDDYLEHLPSGWTYNQNDSYFYYTKALASGETTTPLFTTVKTTLTTVEDFDIIVSAESVQAANIFGIKPTESDAYLTAWDKITK